MRLVSNNVTIEMWDGKKWTDEWIDYTLKGVEKFRIEPSAKVAYIKAHINGDPVWCCPQYFFPDLISLHELQEIGEGDSMEFVVFISDGDFWNNIKEFEGW